MLAKEHAAGEHDEAINASCIDCTRTPEYVAKLRRHRDAMRHQEDAQASMRARREHLYGNGLIPLKAPLGTQLENADGSPIMVKSSERLDHSQCDHERTAKARATCRCAKRTV